MPDLRFEILLEKNKKSKFFRKREMGDGNDAQEGKIKYLDLDQFFMTWNVRSLLQMSPAIEKTMANFFRGDNLAIHFTTNRCKTYFITIVLNSDLSNYLSHVKKILKDKDLNFDQCGKVIDRTIVDDCIYKSCYRLRYCPVEYCSVCL